MAEHFGHERLKVYQKGMQFATMRKTLLDDLPRRVAACDHLDRGAECILLNIAHASADSCPADPSPVEEGRDLLRRIAAMLRQLSKAVRDDI